MSLPDLNILAILGAVVAYMVIGSIWYGVFAKPWMKLKNLKPEELTGQGKAIAT